MGRTNSIKYQLKQAVAEKLAIGEKKKEYQDITRETRAELKSLGVSHEEQLRFNACDDKIFSYATFDIYMECVGRFGDWLIKGGHKSISLEECKEYIQPYIDWRRENGLSANTINTDLSAICKALNCRTMDFERDDRSCADIRKSRELVEPTKYNPAYELNKIIGLRRSDLERLRVSDIRREEDRMVITVDRCKGGKKNIMTIYQPEQIKKIEDYIREKGLKDNERLFTHDMFTHDINFQNTRRLCAQNRYEEVVKDMQEHPDRRDYYKAEIMRRFDADGKRLKEDLDKTIHLRGKHREVAIEQGKPVDYDRVAAMMASLNLNHYRSNVCIDHYLI